MKDKHSADWMEIDPSFNLDSLFKIEESSNYKTTSISLSKTEHVMTTLKRSILHSKTLSKNKDEISKTFQNPDYDNLDDAERCIKKINDLFVRDEKNFIKKSIQNALIVGKHLVKIKELIELKKKDPSLSKHERKQYNFDNFTDKCSLSWSRSYMYFLIFLYDLCEKYPKFKLVTVSLDYLNSNQKYIREGMKSATNINFWTKS